ncbi:MAG: malate/lactate/ureidoglycolate dehydrogenase [Maricaulis sp.]|nr:malate/lactate/ureidoglycolate dehydrogenase [Maricaulis sp.]MDG2044391.1 malate/lactate/ureidoglycolate dehydrogenase [Maricaulis sp.]
MNLDQTRFPAEQLVSFIESALTAADTRKEDAAEIARHLVDANLTGHDSHGIGMLPAYIAHIQGGQVNITATDITRSDKGVIIQRDADSGWGKPAARRLIETAIEKCQQNGLAAATLGNVHHLGRIGAYGEQAAAAGLVSMHFVSVADHAPLVAPFRGSDARFGTNPVCISFPATNKRPSFLLDMATSKIALGKVRVAANKGEKVPPGSLINEHGMETEDPTGMSGFEMKGALLPLGRHKGYGLGFACELLAGVLSGAGTLQPGNPRKGGIQNRMLSILIAPDAFGDTDWMDEEVDAMSDYALASPPMDWDSPVLYPGDPERAWRGKRERDGVPLDEVTVEQLNNAANKAGSSERL